MPFLDPQHEFTARYVAAFAVFVGNWAFFWWGWVGLAAIPLWTVSVKEQFYLCWPPLVARLSTLGILRAAGIMVVIANLSRWYALARHEGARHVWTSTLAHLDSIAAGIILGVLLERRALDLRIGSRLLLITVALGIFALRGMTGGIGPSDLLHPLATILGSPAVVLAGAAILVAFIDLPFRSPALQYLGRISYGLYVYHMSCIEIVGRWFGDGTGLDRGPLRFAMALVLTVGVSAVSYECLEKPFLRLKQRFSRSEPHAITRRDLRPAAHSSR